MRGGGVMGDQIKAKLIVARSKAVRTPKTGKKKRVVERPAKYRMVRGAVKAVKE